MFFPVPGVTIFPGEYAAVRAAREKFIDLSNFRTTESFGAGIAECTSLEALDPLLARAHERCHYGQMMSTFFGLTLWQAETCMVDLTLWQSFDRETREWAPADQISKAANVIRLFCQAMRGQVDLTMDQFLFVANRATEHVAAHWGFPVRTWRSRRPYQDSYLPADRHTADEVVEAGARLAELTYLGTAPVPLPAGLLQEWFDSRLHGDYGRVSELLVTEVADIATAALLVDEALMGPSFLAAGVIDDVFVEDVLPAWRLRPLIHQARADFVPADSDEAVHHCASTLPGQVGLPGSRDEINRLLDTEGDPFGANALTVTGDDVVDLFDDRYRIFALERYRLGFATRSTNPAPYLPGRLERAEEFASMGGFEPILEVYRDTALWNDAAVAKDEAIVLRGYVELVRTIMVDAMLNKTFDLRVLRSAEAAVVELLGAGLVAEWGVTAAALVSHLLGDDATTLFVF